MQVSNKTTTNNNNNNNKKGEFNKMNKKRNKIYKLMTTAALVLVMCVSMILPSMAASAPGDSVDFSEPGTYEKQAEAAITKILSMPIDTPTPNVTFTFKLTAVNVDGKGDSQDMPDLGTLEIVYNIDEDKEETEAKYAGVTHEKGNVKYVVLEEEINFPPDTKGNVWGRGEGIYLYKVEETIEKYDHELDGIDEGSKKSTAVYYIHLWVQHDDATDSYFVQFVEARISTTESEIDVYWPGDDGGEKVDPTPGGYGKEIVDIDDIENGNSGVIFTNHYWKTDGDDKWENDVLAISKKITGNGAKLDDYFDFEVKVTRPSAMPASVPTSVYKAYILNASGNPITGDDLLDAAKNNVTIGNGVTVNTDTGMISIVSGSTVKFSMTNNQKLVFVNLTIGSDVEVMEKGTTGYKASYTSSFKNRTFNADEGVDLGFPSDQDNGAHYLKAGVHNNNVDYTNRAIGGTPTGISVDNLPYIVMIGLALAGLMGFAVVRSRRNAGFDA